MPCPTIDSAEALCEIHAVLLANLPLLVAELTTLSMKVEEIKEELSAVKAQLTATERAYKESGPKTLGDNIQDIRDIQEEGFCRSKDVLRKQGFSQGSRCEDV